VQGAMYTNRLQTNYARVLRFAPPRPRLRWRGDGQLDRGLRHEQRRQLQP
jgi:hypothetical protein